MSEANGGLDRTHISDGSLWEGWHSNSCAERRTNRNTNKPNCYASWHSRNSAHQVIIFRRPGNHSAKLYTPRIELSQWAS